MRFPPASDIKRVRMILGLTQTDLAHMADVSQSTVAKIERGSISAGYETVVRLFTALSDAEPKRRSDVPASSVASSTVTCIQCESNLHEAADVMRSSGYSQLPVLDGDIPVGSISEGRILDLIRNGCTDLKNTAVGDVMDESFPVVSESTPMSLVTSMMGDCRAVLVSHRGRMTGVITRADVLKLV